MCRCDGDAGLDQEHVLAERPEIRIDRVEREHRRPSTTRTGVSRIPGSGGPGSGKPSCTVEIAMPWWCALIRPGQHEHAVAADLLGAGVLAAERGAVADLRDGAGGDQHGAVASGGASGRGEQDVARDEQLGHGGHASDRR